MAQKNPGTEKSSAGKENLTPLMQQYHDIKARYPGMILFFRLGDFFEMFGADAQEAAPLLDVVLTKRQNVPMCGVPFHAVNAYLSKLIKAGKKVAICEQLEEPGSGKGIVRRGVVRVVTPGTLIEDHLLEAKQNNFLAAFFPSEDGRRIGCAYADISTGEFRAAELPADSLASEIARIAPGEVIIPQSAQTRREILVPAHERGITVSYLDDWHFSAGEARSLLLKLYSLQSLKPLGLEDLPLAAAACGGIIGYLQKTQVDRMPALSPVRVYSLDNYLLLDAAAVATLELVQGSRSGDRADSLLAAIDTTVTPMGARAIRQWLLQPLVDRAAIVARQKVASFFFDEGMSRRVIRDTIRPVADLERILGRLSSGAAGPRELVALKNSLNLCGSIPEDLKSPSQLLALPDPLTALIPRLKVPCEVPAFIEETLAEEPPALLKDGGVIRSGYSAELDELRSISRDSKQVISRIEARERERTGISSLKVGYTSVFGYYIEVSKSNLHLVPGDYIRKQTVANGERFVTAELKTFEEKILSADEKIIKLETELFRQLREKVLGYSSDIQRIAAAIAELDVLASFAETAALNNFVLPEVDDGFELCITDGRHPVVERSIKSGAFVANDTRMNGTSDRIILLTGPNMAGKSTYLRQVALIAILAQTGSFVPAAGARIGIVDRIFTRIGAGDNLAGGESTFMVEMHETAHILNQYTARSLIILDEVGRGTSTYDGISIAWAAVEYLAAARDATGQGPKVLFATHYFELTDLEGKLPGVKNYSIAVKEWQNDVIFLHTIVPGAADRSYGIHVAQLAGLPREVISRAYRILGELEKSAPNRSSRQSPGQLDLFTPGREAPAAAPGATKKNSALPSSKILLELQQLNVNQLTPLEALQLLSEWKSTLPDETDIRDEH